MRYDSSVQLTGRVALEDIEDLGGKRIRFMDTPHTPHGWDAGVLYEETTRTLLCGDLFTQLGNERAMTDGELTNLFAGARFDQRRGLFSDVHPVPMWVAAFKARTHMISDGPPCPPA